MKKNIHEAFKQLTNRYNNANPSENVCGIVVLSISKIVNPEHKLLVVKSDRYLISELYKTMKKFFTKFKHLWEKELDIRTIGVLFHLQIGAITQHNNLFGTCHRFGANNIALYGSSACNEFTEIVKRLGQSHSFLLKS